MVRYDQEELKALMAEHRSRMESVELIKDTEIQLGGKIGEGGCGVIFKAKWRDQDVAIKKLKNNLSLEARAEFYTEVEHQDRLDHSNVVQCHGAIE